MNADKFTQKTIETIQTAQSMAQENGNQYLTPELLLYALVDADGEVTEVTLVGTTETNSLQHKISNESPVGRAIIGHGVGETVEVVTPSGASRVYTITKISR